MKAILEALASRQDLSREQARQAFETLMSGELSPGQAGALLMGLRAKGETAGEVAEAVAACLARARLVPNLSGPRIDTCGTGGDCRGSFNCSTAVGLVLAAMGHKVVKHGNRSVSSSCGSADVLEALGFALDTEPEAVAGELARTGFVFLFAPNYHPAFKHVVPLRRELGIRTLFNLLGPLLNPARPTHQILGVASAAVMPLVAESLALSGVSRAAVIHGALGYDELTPFGLNEVLFVKDGEITEAHIDPAPLGLAGGKPENVTVAGKDEALQVLKELLDGYGPLVMQHMLTLNLAVALHLLEDVSIEQGAMRASAMLLSGDAGRHFGITGHA